MKTRDEIYGRIENNALAAVVEGREPMRVLTIRMGQTLHEQLKREARELRTSMNHLCVAALGSVIEQLDEEKAAGDEPVAVVDVLDTGEAGGQGI